MLVHEEYFKNIFNTIREAILVLDENMRVLSANRSFFTVFNVDSADTISSLLYDLGNGQWNIPHLRVLLEDVLPNNDTVDNYEIEHTFESIGRKTMLLNACKIREKKDGQPIILLAIEDITERKRLEELLSESEMRYRRLFETASDGIVLLEKHEGRIVHANPAAGKMLGYSEEEYSGKMLQDIGVPLDMIDFPEIMVTLGRNGIINYEDVQVKTRSGQDIYTDIYLVDRARLAQCNIRDVTERKLAEQERQKFEQQFQQAQKLESLGVLAGGIAHDFNNILTVILCNCSLLQNKPQMAEELVPEIEIAAQRAADLCRQMLIYAGKAQPVPTRVNMAALVDEMVKMLKATITQNVVIKLLPSADIPSIKADASQIRQIVMNLIINASEAIGTAQGEIGVSLAKIAIGEELADKDHLGNVIAPGGYVCLEVRDNGCGMDAETRHRIFEPFYTTKFTGRGLGMSAVLGIIKAHNGALQLFSQPGQGTTFKVYLPLQISAATGEKSLPHVSPVPWQGSGTVLLVEDEPQLIMVAKILLKALGFSVIEALNGKEALELYQKNGEYITLVMTDLGMPVMDGYELFRELKKLKPELPIIITSGFSDAGVTSQIPREDMAGILSKPYTFDQLREVLKAVAEGAQEPKD